MASRDRATPRTSPSGDRRRRAGETLVVLGAACLLVATFLPWYGVEGGPVRRFELGATGGLPPTGDAWRVLTTVRFLLFALIIAAWIPAALAAADQRAAVGRASLGVALLGAVTGVVLLGRVVDQPGRDREVDLLAGAHLGVLATALIVAGGLLGWREAAPRPPDATPRAPPLPSPRGRPSRLQAGLLAAAVLTAVFVAFFRLGTSSWNFDEYFYGAVGDRFLRGQFSVTPGPHPYLGTYLVAIVPRLTGSESTSAVRLLPAAAGLAVGVVLLAFGLRVAGWRAAVLAFALWTLLPHRTVMAGAPFTDVRLERYGLLDGFMVTFVAAALYAGWRWAERGRWGWATATAVCAGLAVSCKLVGAIVLVPLVLLAVLTPGRDWRRLAQTAWLLAGCAVTFLLSFAPVLPQAPDRLRAMIDLSRANEAAGHATVIAGEVHVHAPPWWANAWFMAAGLGALTTAGLIASVAAGVVVVDRRLLLYLASAVVAPALALAGLYTIALPHYFYVWLAPLTLLAAVALDALMRRGRVGVVLAALFAAPLAVAAAGTVADVARLEPGDYRVAASMLRRSGLERGTVLVLGYRPVLCAYLPAARITSRPAPRPDAIVVDPVQRRRGDAFGVLRHLGAHRVEYARSRAGRLEVFLRREARARVRGGARPVTGVDCYRGP